jgi:formamidopyrimidine-DNA glycosylase
MPELPEVEVTRRSITDRLVGRTITEVRTTAPSYFFLTPPTTLRKRLIGRTVTALSRHGKYLLAGLDDDARVFLHLGMTGQLFTASAKSVRLLRKSTALDPHELVTFKADEHTHLVLGFADRGEQVLFRDVRKFGKVRWLSPGQSDPRLDKLGPDALSVTAELLLSASRSRKVAVKTFLLDQSVLAGVGNIYADEALFRAGVRPTRSANKLTHKECEALAQSTRAVLMRSIETGGSSIDDYVQPDGRDGGFQHERKVYGRAGTPCSVCGTVITRIVLGGRATCYCARCQR